MMSELAIEIEEMLLGGYDVKSIAAELGCPVEMVEEVAEMVGEE